MFQKLIKAIKDNPAYSRVTAKSPSYYGWIRFTYTTTIINAKRQVRYELYMDGKYLNLWSITDSKLIKSWAINDFRIHDMNRVIFET